MLWLMESPESVEHQSIKLAGRHLYEDDTVSGIFHLEVERGYEDIIDEIDTKLSKQDMVDVDNPTCSSCRFAIFLEISLFDGRSFQCRTKVASHVEVWLCLDWNASRGSCLNI